MKTLCAVLALSAGCGVASAQYIIDTFVGEAHAGITSSEPVTGFFPSGPTDSTVPTDSGVRQVLTSASAIGGHAYGRMLNVVQGGSWSMNWLVDCRNGEMGETAMASAIMQWDYTNLDLGSMTTLSASVRGSRFPLVDPGVILGSGIPPDYLPQVSVDLHDMDGRLARWTFTLPMLYNSQQVQTLDWSIDLTSPHSMADGFDFHNLGSLTLRHHFRGDAGIRVAGLLNYTELAFVPSPGAAAVLGLGGVACMRRRRR